MGDNHSPLLPEASAKGLVSPRLAARYKVFPLRLDGDVLVVAVADPDDFDLLDELRISIGQRVRGEKADSIHIAEAIRTEYGVGAETLDTLSHGRASHPEFSATDGVIDDLSEDASIIKFVNQLIVDASNSRATDIHLEPFENRLRVRYRIDGILVDARIPESIWHFKESIVSRIKVMANLDVAERRIPQDGRIRVRIGGNNYDLRVSVIPIAHGQSVDIRLLQSSNVLMGLDAIGYDEETISTVRMLMKRPHGIVLMTGPTGSGKTTTLYAILSLLNTPERKILTIEDPVEYQVEGICQMTVRADIGFTFATGLRSMLRHDPDVMLIGEIRDAETAELAIRCSLTGHLVFSTLHTNDAAGAAPRLLDMGIEPYLLASSLEAIVAQRLVRTVCPKCKQSHVPDREALIECGVDPDKVRDANLVRGAGCNLCRNTGYLGRTAIHELVLIDETLRNLIVERSPSSLIRNHALAQGMVPLRESGWRKAAAGITTVDEVLRVTQDDSRRKRGN
jgi:general secretion pathway protein E